jgi:DNA-binding MarR family transcriptional regulator
LAKAASLTIGELAIRTATAQSSVSEVVARLAANDLVLRQRSETDRRCTDISLSIRGGELVRCADETVQEKLLAAFGRLPAPQRMFTAAGLQSWAHAAGLSGVEPTMFFEP